MATIWLDITLIKERQGLPMLGISRVELECCRYFLSIQDYQVRFCYYEKRNGNFHEIPREIVQEIISPSSQPRSKPALSADKVVQLKNITLRVIAKLPFILQQPVLNLCKKTYAFILRQADTKKIKMLFRYNTWFTKHKAATPTLSLDETYIFKPYDIYVSAGLDWEKNIRELYRLKKQYHLKILGFCYDMIPVLFPHLCFEATGKVFPAYFVDLCWTANKIICISKSTREDLKNFSREMNTPLPELSCVRLGSEINDSGNKTTDEIKNLSQEKYILYVSTIERRKNHEVLYKAYCHLIEKGFIPPKLIFVGGEGWFVNDFLRDLAVDPRIQGLIIILRNLNDDTLALLYQNALFTVYPSLYEGWGLPVDESLAYGKFCLASNISSLPEVGENFIEYIDPLDTIKWAERLAYYSTHEDELKIREQFIKEHYKPYPWRKTAAFVFDEAKSLLNEETKI